MLMFAPYEAYLQRHPHRALKAFECLQWHRCPEPDAANLIGPGSADVDGPDQFGMAIPSPLPTADD